MIIFEINSHARVTEEEINSVVGELTRSLILRDENFRLVLLRFRYYKNTVSVVSDAGEKKSNIRVVS